MDLEEFHCSCSDEAIEIAADGKDHDAEVEDDMPHSRYCLEDGEFYYEDKAAKCDLSTNSCSDGQESRLCRRSEHVIFDSLPADLLSSITFDLKSTSQAHTFLVLLAYCLMLTPSAITSRKESKIASNRHFDITESHGAHNKHDANRNEDLLHMHIVLAYLEVLIESMSPCRRFVVDRCPRIREDDTFAYISQDSIFTQVLPRLVT